MAVAEIGDEILDGLISRGILSDDRSDDPDAVNAALAEYLKTTLADDGGERNA